MYGWDYGHVGPGAWILMGLGMLLFWSVVVVGVVMLVRYFSAPTTSSAPHVPSVDGPEQILKDRLARGEIDVDEYRSRMSTLRASA